ncbi:uncharacterized protein LOC122521786 [Polistes fuscatus]|uniref:uncharacterized protein LOC122521786 n=1 Tax=Polistes fuscatus TaxID=30207 RepID=UPI001CA97BE1|nr:uncharacterized protein LOC122521786 [Polistes fuscatus]
MEGTNSVSNQCGRDTHTTAVLGGGRTGHPSSTACYCHESAVGNPAQTLVTASGSCPRVGDLACGMTNATGRRGRSLEEGPKCTIRCIEEMESDTIPVRFMKKRARPVAYTSSSEDEVIDLTNMYGVVPEGPSVSSLETERLIDFILDHAAEAEVRRKTCGNIKGEISGRIKNCNLGIAEIARELQARNRANCGSDIRESLEQLRTEARATNNRLKQVEEECTRLRRELKRKDALLEKAKLGNTANAPTRAVAVAANQARSFAEGRLVAARKEEDLDGKVTARILAELSKSMINIQEELIEIKGGRGSYAQVTARPRVAPPPPTPTPLTSVPDGDGFVEVRRREALKKVETCVNLEEIGAKGLSYRRGLTGSCIWQVRGKDANAKADKVAQALRGVLPEAKIARPQRTSPIKLVGIYPTTTLTAIKCGLLEGRAGIDPNLISMGDIHLGRGGRYEATVVAPTALCQAAVGKGSILVGRSRVRVFPVRPRPLRCHRCLARGHVAASCPAPSARMGVCFRCGEPGHVTKDCGNKPKCPICVEAGRSQTSHRAGSSAIVAGKGGGTCSLVRRGLFYVAAKWGDSLVVSVYFPPSENINSFCRLLDELEELLGTFPALPALVAGDFNARFPRWDPEGRSNLKGELLCMWANRLNLSLGNQVGHPTCVRPQGSSVVDLTWGSPAASVRLSDWRVDEAESLSDHLYIIFKYGHEAAGFRSLRSRDRTFPRWDKRAVDEDRLAAALVSGNWTRDNGASVENLVEWANKTLLRACEIAMPRVRSTVNWGRAVPWWSPEIAVLRRAATAARRRYLRARRSGDLVRIGECLMDRRETRRSLVRAIRRAKASA